MPAENQTVGISPGDSRRIVIPVKDAAGADLPLAGRRFVGRQAKASGQWEPTSSSSRAARPATGHHRRFHGHDRYRKRRHRRHPPGSYYHEAEVTFADGTVANCDDRQLRDQSDDYPMILDIIIWIYATWFAIFGYLVAIAPELPWHD